MTGISCDIGRAVERATRALLQRRNAEGYWEGRLASSPLATAVALCALSETGGPGDGETGRGNWSGAIEYLRKTQNPDGGWGDTEISKSNLAATLLVLCADAALQPTPSPRLPVPPSPSAPEGLRDDQRRAAREYVEKLGGLSEGLTRVYGRDMTFQVPIRMAAAYAGLLPWNKVDALPFELALAPRSLMGALRLPVVSYALPALVCVGLARHVQAPSWFLPLRFLRESLINRALNVALKMQPESGGYLEAIPITAFCLIGLKSAGRAEHPIALNAKKFLLATQREDGSWPVEVNLSVWNTTRAIEALAASGLLNTALSEDERAKTRDWLLAQQTRGVSVYSDAQPGGWGWNHLSGSVPDVDDTSGAILALRALGVKEDHSAMQRGREWLLKLQNRNGGWPTFCRGWGTLPFDRSAPDLTAHAYRAIEALKTSPYVSDEAADSATNLGGNYLFSKRNEDGSFCPLWFGCEYSSDLINRTYGTAHVIFSWERTYYEMWGLRTACEYLLSIQNPDGGFGGCKGAPSTAEETGLALRALLISTYRKAGQETIEWVPAINPKEECCARAARWLIEHQREDGSWNPAPIGFYFAVLWYYEELYPLCYALGGLGAYKRALEAKNLG